MRELIKMIIVLTILSSLSGCLLAAIRNGTKEQIENQQLKFLKAPAIKQIMTKASNDPIEDKFKIKKDDAEVTFFVGKTDNKPDTVAFECFGKGFEGPIGVMVGVNTETDKIIGVGLTTHSETPGVGSRAQSEPDLANQFKELSMTGDFKVKPDGGKIDAIGGATVTSRGVCIAVSQAAQIYDQLKDKIKENVKAFSK